MSGEKTSENVTAASVGPDSMVGARVSSANVLEITKAWEKRAVAHEEASREQNMFGGDAMRQMHWEISNTYRTCIVELRRQVERESLRQPSPNTEMSHVSAANTKPR